MSTPGGQPVTAAEPATSFAAGLAERYLSPLPDAVEAMVLAFVPVVVSVVIWGFIWRVLARSTRDEGRNPTRKLVDKTSTPAAVLFVVVGLMIGVAAIEQRGFAPAWLTESWPQVSSIASVIAGTWIVIAVIAGADDMILARYRIDVRDNLKARRMHTQVAVISRTLMIVVGVVGGAIALMSFDSVERLGASLLASAGIAGIVVGFAARPVLGNIIAGIQIALTQPIRIDDAVVIENEWGWIEEITTTYVVVRIWDQRRLIVPFSKIIEEPFENWTRSSSEILGSVTLYVDYACPVDAVRNELDRILDGHPKWDGRAKVLQTIDATERTMVLRALVTAEDSPTAWELRCDVRERLLGFLQREHPYALPREREVDYREEQWPRRTPLAPPSPADADLDDPTLRGDGGAPPAPPPAVEPPSTPASGP
ncbi:MAG: mechanosensitive ion channel family protein [Planctomycetota bacterium]